MSDDIDDLTGYREFEEKLRAGLADQAEAIEPHERLNAVLAGGEPAAGRRGLFVAAGVAVFLIVAALGVGYLLSITNPMYSASSGSQANAPQAGQAGGAASDSAEKTATRTTQDAPATWAMPVYAVVAGTSTQPWLLSRTFMGVPEPGSQAARVQTAITTLLTAVSPTGQTIPTYAYQQPWSSGTTATVTVSGTGITVVLNQPGPTGLSAEQQKIAVQSIVWTATAAAQSLVPVTVQVEGGQAPFASVPAGAYSRPTTGNEFTELAPLWIDTPAPGTKVTAPVTLAGQACTFEAALAWELLQGTTKIGGGYAMATSGCPTRGTYLVDLGSPAPGTYTVRVWETSAKDGSVAYATQSTFTVG